MLSFFDTSLSNTLSMSLLPSKGYLEAYPGRVCIVSFPASLGQRAWNAMAGGDLERDGRLGLAVNFACVWTGDNNSPMSEWFDPWVENVVKARERGMTLLVYGHSNHPEENPFKHVSPERGEQKFRLGVGQQAEVKYMNEQGIPYKVLASDAEGAIRGIAACIVGNRLASIASDGPIHMP